MRGRSAGVRMSHTGIHMLRTRELHDLAGRHVWLLASGGPEGVAALNDTVEAGTPLAQLVRLLAPLDANSGLMSLRLNSVPDGGMGPPKGSLGFGYAGGLGDLCGVQALRQLRAVGCGCAAALRR